MRTVEYHCKHPETRPIGKGIHANYDGEVLTVWCGRMQAGITASRGETVYVTVGDSGVVRCSTRKKKAAPKR